MMRVYGCKISYYTGKLETYLRYRSIDYQNLPTVGNERKLRVGAGVVQMPVVELDDGRWLTDTTPILAWLESEQSAPSIYPEDPTLKFVANLIEDYADEWLWRPAMHYRWNYRADRNYAAQALYDDLIANNRPIPRFIAIQILKSRQLNGFVRGDGVTAKTREHVEQTYLTALDCLQAIFERRPFVFGDTPTNADFALMGPMLRHFGQDPTPTEIMRNRAPAVYEWVARMWNTKPNQKGPKLITAIDQALGDLLVEISQTHLAQLRQNAHAYGKNLTRYDQTIQDCHYVQVPTSRYRVWCLEELQRAWTALDDDTQTKLHHFLSPVEASVLWDGTSFMPSNYDRDKTAPFNQAINVFGRGVPPR
ncbi:MAG: glutathione S-transferase [Robiginitomaculum sp.]|nr:MAG: glutathione S-transferase [Robiginitomaculum sp.]